MIRKHAAAGLLSTMLALQPGIAAADLSQTLTFDIGPQQLQEALIKYSALTGVQITSDSSVVSGKSSAGVNGTLPARSALGRLLDGTGLTFDIINGNTVVIVKPMAKGSEARQVASQSSRMAYRESRDTAGDGTTRAQDGASESGTAAGRGPEQVEEVIVTSVRPFKPESSDVATKFPLRLVETPQSISVLTDDLLATVGAHDIFDLDGLVPGLQEQGTSNGFDARFIMRGFALSREDGIKIDGVSIPNRFILDLAAIERVEVVRGPSSVIYGQTDYGGTINFVLKRPMLDTRNLSARASVGSYAFRRADLDATLPIGEKVGVRLVGAYEESDSFVDIANHETKVAAPSILFNLGERTDLFISTYFQERNGQDHLGFGAQAGGVIPDVPRRNFLGPSWNRYDSRASQTFVQLRHGITEDFDLTFNAAYSDVTTGFRTGYSRARPDAEGNTSVFRNGDGDNRSKTSFVEIVGTWKFAGFGEEQSLISFTADMRTVREYSTSVGGAQPVIGMINIFDPTAGNQIPYVDRAKTVLFTGENDLRGISATTLLRFPHSVNLMLGGRYGEASASSMRMQTGTTVGPIGVGTNGAKDRNDVFVPKIGLTWQFVPDWYAYATYAEGVIFQFERDYRDSLLPNETGVQQEVGIKADLLDKRLGFAAAVFSIDRKNVLIGDPSNLDFSTTADAQKHRGIEFELLGQPLPGLNVSLNYAWLDVKVMNEAEFGSSRQANVPKHSGGLFVNQEFRTGWLEGLSTGFGVTYVDDRAADAFSVPAAVLPSYIKLDLFASYQFNEKFRVGLNARNVTDEEVLVSSFGVDFLGLMYRDARSVSLTFDMRL